MCSFKVKRLEALQQEDVGRAIHPLNPLEKNPFLTFQLLIALGIPWSVAV